MGISICRKTAVCLLYGLLGSASLNGQTARSGQIRDTIPYEIIDGKIVMEAGLNGKKAKFIFDTGGVNLIMSDMTDEYGITVKGRGVMADVNNRTTELYSGAMPALQLSENLSVSPSDVMIISPQPYFKEMGVVGALGSEAFAEVCVTFLHNERKLLLTHPYRPEGIPRKEGWMMDLDSKSHPFIPVEICGTPFRVLFDTGMEGFLSLSAIDYGRIASSPGISVTAEGEGIWHVGIAGFAGTPKERIGKLDISSLKVGNKTFVDAGTLTTNVPVTIMGRKLLDYGTVILDYPRSLFFFIPHTPEPDDLSCATKVWNVNILPVVDHFEVTAVVGDGVDAVFGERVWSIDGISLEDFPLDQSRVIGVMNSIETGSACIEVGETKATARKVKINKI